jgi:hypothetical protein
MKHVGLVLGIFQDNIFLHNLNIFIVDSAPLRCCKITKVSKIMSLRCFLVLCSFSVSLESSSLAFMHGYESELVLHFCIERKFFRGSHFIHVKNLKDQEIGSEGCQTPIFMTVINANSIMIFNLPQESGIYHLVWLI